MRRNMIVILIITVVLVLLFVGCTNTVNTKKFILDSELSHGYRTGNSAELTMRLTNNWKTIDVTTGYDGPFTYSVYLNDEQLEISTFSILRELRLEKSATEEWKVTIDTSAKGKYRIEVSACFGYGGKEYKFGRVVMEFDK